MNVTIHGSHGDIVVNTKTGFIVSKDLDGQEYEAITHFDIPSYTKTWGYFGPKDIKHGIDIVDIGYWYLDKLNRLNYAPQVNKVQRLLMHNPSDEFAQMYKYLCACLRQIEDYSPNDWIIDPTGEFDDIKIADIYKFLGVKPIFPRNNGE